MCIYIYISLSLYATNYIRLSYHSHKFKFIELLVILTWKSGWRSRSAWPQLMASWQSRSLELFQRHGLLQPTTARAPVASLLGTLGRASQAWYGLIIFVLRHVWYCTYFYGFYGWQILQPILLPHSGDFTFNMLPMQSMQHLYIHICCTFSREGNCLTGHASFAQSDLQMCHGQNMVLNFKDFKTCYLLVSHKIIHMKANGQPPLTWRNIPSR